MSDHVLHHNYIVLLRKGMNTLALYTKKSPVPISDIFSWVMLVPVVTDVRELLLDGATSCVA